MRESGITILIVDADPAWRSLLFDFFELHSFKVILLDGVKPGFQIPDPRPDIIISEFQLSQGIPEIICTHGRLPSGPHDPQRPVFLKTTALSELLDAVKRLLRR